MPATVTVPSPGEILSNPTYRRVIGIALLFVAFVVWPQVFGVGPLSSVNPTGFVSAYYDPSTNVLTANLDFALGSGSTATAVLQLVNADDLQVSLPPTTVSVDVDKDASRVFYTYTRDVETLPLIKCVEAEGRDPIGILANSDDWEAALEDARSKIAAQLGASPDVYFGSGNYREIVTEAYTEGSFFGVTQGDAVVHLLVCGYRPSAFSVYHYTSTSPRLCFYTRFTAQDGKLVATSDLICNDAYAGSSVSLVANGVNVGYVEYRGAKDVYVPPGDSVPDYGYLVREVFTTDSGDLAKGIYAISDAQLISDYRNHAEAFVSKLQVLPYSVTVDARFTLSGWHVTAESTVASELKNLASLADTDLQTIRSNLIQNTVYRIDTVEDKYISVYKPYTKDYRIHDLQLTVYGKFVGLVYRRAVPDIVAAAVDSCSDKGCEIEVRVRNAGTSPDEVGPVTVTARSQYFTAQDTVYFDEPGQEKVLRLFAVPSGVSGDTTATVEVIAEAKHPLDPKVDKYTLTVSIKKSASCTVLTPTCGQDDKGAYYIVCESPTDPAPEKRYCGEGEVCINGQGCVSDVLKSVTCLGPRDYKAVYQYAGEQFGTCPADMVCDESYAAKNRMPPCRAADYCELHPDDPQCGGVPPPRPVEIHVSEYRPSVKDIATGLALIGVALLVMP